MALLAVDDRRFIEDPYPRLAELREAGPIHWDEDWGIWLVTRHDEVKAAQLDRRLGRVKQGYAEPEDFRPIRELDLKDWEAYYATERYSLLMLEPPEHTRLRGLVSRAFTPRRVRELRQPVTGIARALLADLVDRPQIDLLADYAQPYSLRVIAALLGAPADDADLLLSWSHAIVKMYELNTTIDDARRAVEASRDFITWTEALIDDRRKDPQDDLITALCQAETEDGILTDAEITSTVILLLNAGHEATVNTMGNGVTALLETPGAWQRLSTGEVTSAVAIEEMMRFDSPLQLFERYVLADGVEIGGERLAVGDEIALLFGAANRDPRRYEAPDEFRVDRGDAGHITFGAGIHHCLGAPLARVELDVAVAELVATFPDLHLAEPPEREPGFVIRGYEDVVVSSGR